MSVAQEKLRIRDCVAKLRDLEDYRGGEWWQLSDAESKVFSIALEEMPVLIAVYQLYYDVLDITETIERERIADLREELPWLKKLTVIQDEWLRFAKLFGLSYRSANAFYSKYEFWEIAQGLVEYPDECLVGEPTGGNGFNR